MPSLRLLRALHPLMPELERLIKPLLFGIEVTIKVFLAGQHSPCSLVVVNRLTHICLVHERYKILRVLFLELMMLLLVLRAILMAHVLDLNVHLFVHLIRLVCAFIQIFSYAVELKLYEFGLAVSFVVVVVVQLLPLHLDVLKLNSRFVHPLVYQEGLSHWVHCFTRI